MENEQIKELYRQQKDARLKALEDAYTANLDSELAGRAGIAGAYREKANELAAEYEKQKRSFNEAAAAAGLNSGAHSQAELSRQSAYMQGMSALKSAEGQAVDESAARAAKLESEYKSAVAQAIADSDYKLAEALYKAADSQQSADESRAKLLASYGDFSLYARLYGEDTAAAMARLWAAQNPDLAYRTGKLTAEEYKKYKSKKI